MPTGPERGSTDPIKAGQEGVGFLVNQTSRAFGRRMSKEIRQFNISSCRATWSCGTFCERSIRALRA